MGFKRLGKSRGHKAAVVSGPYPSRTGDLQNGQQLRTGNAGLIDIRSATVGSGRAWVYCYYFPYIRDAKEKNGQQTWPCKIGSTGEKDPRDRVVAQIQQTAVFELPVIGFLAKVEDSLMLERAIQADLDRCKIRNEGAGTEWFETNLKEVRRSYRQVRWPNWYQRPIRFWVSLTMEIKAKRYTMA